MVVTIHDMVVYDLGLTYSQTGDLSLKLVCTCSEICLLSECWTSELEIAWLPEDWSILPAITDSKYSAQWAKLCASVDQPDETTTILCLGVQFKLSNCIVQSEKFLQDLARSTWIVTGGGGGYDEHIGNDLIITDMWLEGHEPFYTLMWDVLPIMLMR